MIPDQWKMTRLLRIHMELSQGVVACGFGSAWLHKEGSIIGPCIVCFSVARFSGRTISFGNFKIEGLTMCGKFLSFRGK